MNTPPADAEEVAVLVQGAHADNFGIIIFG
jgi:hypothetical protein